MRALGILLVAAGLLWASIAFQMNTTVTSDSKTIGSGQYGIHVPAVTVNNIGLMETRRNHLTFAGLTMLAGIILIGFGSINSQSSGDNSALRPCPKCAELIQPAAIKCRYCSSELSVGLNAVPSSYPTEAPEEVLVSEEDLMSQFGITHEKGMFVYQTYRYEKLGDALAYAKRQAAKDGDAQV